MDQNCNVCPKKAENVIPKSSADCPFKGPKAQGLASGDKVVDTEKNESTPSLSVTGTVSQIPKAGTNDFWVYPSPQRWYNAVKKKENDPSWGFDPSTSEAVTEDAVPTAVFIHNHLNEQAWKEILEFEDFHKDVCDAPKLKSFRGRATDLSPKAWILHMLGLTPLPFDRHDWIIDRCGKPVKYVIDYYAEDLGPEEVPNIFIDVRPALTIGGAIDRLRLSFNKFWSTDNGGRRFIDISKTSSN